MKKRLLIITGPSGVGKGSVLKLFNEKIPDLLISSVSHTSRKKRNGEVDGKDYHFVRKEDFESMISQKKFIEYTIFAGNYYGTSFQELEKLDNCNEKIIYTELEMNGVKFFINNADYDVLIIVFLPRDEKTIMERLKKRGTETFEEIKNRVHSSLKQQKELDEYPQIIKLYNNDIEETTQKLIEIVINKFQIDRSKYLT